MLLTEICHPQHRGPLTTVYNTLWNLGSLSKLQHLLPCSGREPDLPDANHARPAVVSVIGWGTAVGIDNHWSWRSITLIQAVPSVIQLAGVWWIPESPRFLISKDKPDQALAVLAKHHGGGDVNNATVQFQFREIKETIIMESQANRSSSYMDFLRTKGNRWRLAIVISLGVFSQYSGNALFSNYIDDIYTNAGIKEQNQKLAVCHRRTPSL